jgi:hypothetical protein
MMKRRIVLTVGCLLLCAAAVGTWNGFLSGDGSLGFGIIDQGINQAGERTVLLLLTNVGGYRICYPDSFEVQTKGTEVFTYIQTEHRFLEPGDEVQIKVSFPRTTTNWCGLVHYYRESPWNVVRMRLGSSPLGGRLPSLLNAVPSQVVRGPWMDQ